MEAVAIKKKGESYSNAEVRHLLDGVAARIAEERVDLAGAERVLGAGQDRDHEAAHEVAGEQADGAGAAREQAAGQWIRTERQPVGGIDHPLSGGRRDLSTGGCATTPDRAQSESRDSSASRRSS